MRSPANNAERDEPSLGKRVFARRYTKTVLQIVAVYAVAFLALFVAKMARDNNLNGWIASIPIVVFGLLILFNDQVRRFFLR